MLCRTYHGIKIFKFEPSTSTNVTHSYAKLEGPENSKLPDSFVLCTSHLETSLDGNSFFTIFGEDGQPWMSFPIYSTEGYPVLWVRQSMSNWIRVMEIEQVWFNFWIHICIQFNVQSGTISTIINRDTPYFHALYGVALFVNHAQRHAVFPCTVWCDTISTIMHKELLYCYALCVAALFVQSCTKTRCISMHCVV